MGGIEPHWNVLTNVGRPHKRQGDALDSPLHENDRWGHPGPYLVAAIEK